MTKRVPSKRQAPRSAGSPRVRHAAPNAVSQPAPSVAIMSTAIDIGRLLMIAEGDQWMVRNLIDDALVVLPTRMLLLETAVSDRQVDKVATQSHHLWTMLYQLAAPSAGAAAHALYTAAVMGDGMAMQQGFTDLTAEMDTLLDAMQIWSDAKALQAGMRA